MQQYTFSYQYPNRQYIDIQLVLEDLQQEVTHLYLPAWRPGRYQMANFAKHVQVFEPRDEQGNRLGYQKTDSHCWAVNTAGVRQLTVTYNYFAAKLDAGNTYLDEDQLYLNPINCALYEPNRMEDACRVKLAIPDDYKIATALNRVGKNAFEAQTFHHLTDSPLIASDSLKNTSLEVEGYHFYLWFLGVANPDYDRLKQDFTCFIQKAIEGFGELPVPEYHFFFQLPPYPLGHGVEHQESTVIALGPGYNLMKPEVYQRFLGLSAHELYHTWNVKALRPADMMPYHYQQPNYSRLGYIAEGVTTYYGDLILLRSGRFSFADYQGQFNKLLRAHLQNYGRFYRSVSESSFDTWLDGYESAAPARKTSIYIKGMLVSFLLDTELMRLTGNKANLDTVMADLYRNFGRHRIGYTGSDLQANIEKIAGGSFDGFFDAYIKGTAPLEKPLEHALDYLGLRLVSNDDTRNWEKQFGIRAQENKPQPVVTQVAPGSPAEQAGLSHQDELVAINHLKIDQNLADLFAYYHSDTIQLTIFRNNQLKDLHLAADGDTYFQDAAIHPLAAPSKNQQLNFSFWSHQDFPVPATAGADA